MLIGGLVSLGALIILLGILTLLGGGRAGGDRHRADGQGIYLTLRGAPSDQSPRRDAHHRTNAGCPGRGIPHHRCFCTARFD